MDTLRNVGLGVSALFTGVISLALLSVILSNQSSTANVLQAFFSGLTGLITATVTPVQPDSSSGGGGGFLNSLGGGGGFLKGLGSGGSFLGGSGDGGGGFASILGGSDDGGGSSLLSTGISLGEAYYTGGLA